jgi:hypothetical protein
MVTSGNPCSAALFTSGSASILLDPATATGNTFPLWANEETPRQRISEHRVPAGDRTQYLAPSGE